MKKFSFYAILSLLFIALPLAYSGCGGGGVTSPTGTNSSNAVDLVMQMNNSAPHSVNVPVSGKAAGDWNDPVYGHMNPWYRDAFQIPQACRFGIIEYKLLTTNNYNDANAYEIISYPESGYTVNSPYEVVMNDTTPVTAFQNTAAAISAGTYPYIAFTVIYVEVTVNADIDDGQGYIAHRFRIYMSTSQPAGAGSAIQAGDVVVYKNNTWNWISNGLFVPISNARPGGTASGWDIPHVGEMITGPPTLETGVQVVQDMNWSLRTTNDLPPEWITRINSQMHIISAEDYIFSPIGQLASPLVISTSGVSATVNMVINVTKTLPSSESWAVGTAINPADLNANGSGIFIWDDITEDNQFKPAINVGLGGDGAGGAHDEGYFMFECPYFSITAQ